MEAYINVFIASLVSVVIYFVKQVLDKVKSIDTNVADMKLNLAVYSEKIAALQKELHQVIEEHNKLEKRIRELEMRHAS
jgi:cytochrome c-type biogenesis protein CcmH/NrfG